VLHSWLGGVVNVYPRCASYVDTGHGHWNDVAHRWERPAELAEAEFLPGDLKPDNLGYLAGKLVVLDYDMNWNGCPHDRSGVPNRFVADDLGESA
jgi:hypothetical protein